MVCHPTLLSNGTAQFPTNDSDLRILLADADAIQKQILPYIVMVAACFFALKVLSIGLELWFTGRAWLRVACVIKLISSYVSLFLVIASASEVTFALSGLAFGNTLGQSDIKIYPSVPFQGLHWALAVFSLFFHLASTLHLDLHGPLLAWNRGMPYVPKPLTLGNQGNQKLSGGPPPQFTQSMPVVRKPAGGAMPPPPGMGGLPPPPGTGGSLPPLVPPR